ILIFSLIELTIGVFGFFSLGLIDAAGGLLGTDSLLHLVMLSFLVLIVPTGAMGATLPVLVTELVDITDNVGVSTGPLYFINPLGAAAGAFGAGLVLLSLDGLNGIVGLAAVLNVSISAAAYLALARAP